MNYQEILKVNGEINMIDLKGKNYAMVPERVTAFRKLFPDGFIITDILSNDGTTVLMQAKVGYYKDGEPVTLATGLAQEVRGKGMVNGTSHIENCETSAVGRALGMIGLGINGGGICSAEELVNAITAQNQMKDERQEKQFTPPLTVGNTTFEVVKTVPNQEQKAVEDYLKTAMKALREARGIDAKKNNALFEQQLKVLKAAGLAPDKPLREYSLDEAETLIESMYNRFDSEGVELK